MIVLALDVGDRRIGVAVSDPSGMLARTVTTVERTGRDFGVIAGLVERHAADRIVAGYPRNMNGSVGEQARKVETYVRGLAKHVSVPIELWDERLSSAEAERLMREAGRRPEERRRRIDAVAAAVILQRYLDADAGRESS